MSFNEATGQVPNKGVRNLSPEKVPDTFSGLGIKMKQATKRRWKKRARWAALFGCVVPGLFAVLVFSRLHFPNVDVPLLARLQWNHSAVSVGDAVTPQIIGHRGSGTQMVGHGQRIGNTASAIRGAIDGGADWIEIDIRVSSDGYLVAFHDETIDLKTTGSGEVSALSLGVLRSVDVLVDPAEKILTLDKVFGQFHSEDRKWVFDVKVRGIQDELLPWIDQRLSPEQVILIGTHDVLGDYAQCRYSRGYVAPWNDFGVQVRALFSPSTIIERCEGLGCDYLVLPVIFTSPRFVDEASARGIEVWSYGSDDDRDLAFSAAHGIRGVIVDDPGNARGMFRRSGAEAVTVGE